MELLKLIEQVDPNDTEALDEIDARVHDYLLDIHLKNLEKKNIRRNIAKAVMDMSGAGKRYTKYTRSRDALKAIRPEGWLSGFCQYITGYKYIIEDEESGLVIRSREFPTEELAELHVIIQAIQFERENATTPPHKSQGD